MAFGVDRNQGADGSGSSVTPIEENIIDAKGDLIVGTADNTAARLAVGANDRILMADSAQTEGVKWATPAQVRTAIDVLPNSIIDAKGDIIVGTAADTPARKAVGTNGQIIVADSSQSDGLIWTDYTREPINVNPNWLIDQINEGALYTVTGGGSAVQGPDGWTGFALNAPGVFKLRTVADPDRASRKCLEITCTTADATIAAGDRYQLETVVEGYDVADLSIGTASASQITVKFDMRFSVTGTYGIHFRNSAQNRTYVATVTQNAANVWETKTVTLTLDTSGTWLYTNGVGLRMFFTLAAGTDFQGTAGTWQASGTLMTTAAQANFMSSNTNIGYIGPVHIIPGGVALAYHKQDIERELRKAQRHYEKTFSQGTAVAQNTGSTIGAIYNVTAGAGSGVRDANWRFKVEKRSVPTILTYNPLAANANWSDASVARPSDEGTNGVVISNSGIPVDATGAYIHVTANARLS